jgi:hypothetical protein
MKTGNIVEVYTCGDCGSVVEISWTGTGVRNLTKGGFLIIHVVGIISSAYCSECRMREKEIALDFMEKIDKKIFRKVFDPKSSKLYH